MKRQGQQTKRETLSKWKGFFLIEHMIERLYNEDKYSKLLIG